MPMWILRLSEFDERLLRAVVGRRRAGLDILVRLITHLGDAPVAILLAGLLAVGVYSPLQMPGARAAFALAFSHLLVQLLKRSFSRSRPRLPVGIRSLVHPPDRFSFPSGHAAAGLSIALSLALSLPLAAAIPVLLLGVAVGMSRCYLGVHYPGDVVAGWVLAAASVFLASPFFALFG